VIGDFLKPSGPAVRAEHVHYQRDPLDDSRPMCLAAFEVADIQSGMNCHVPNSSLIASLKSGIADPMVSAPASMMWV